MNLPEKLERAAYSFIVGALLGSAVGAVTMALCVKLTLDRCGL